MAGCLPMIHTHTFLAFGIMCAVLFFAYLFKETDKKKYFLNWVFFCAITAVLALPQLFFWTFQQTSESSYHIMFQFNWVNHQDPYMWFYVKNWGIIALFIVPAVIYANKDNKKLFLSAVGSSKAIVLTPSTVVLCTLTDAISPVCFATAPACDAMKLPSEYITIVLPIKSIGCITCG